jgi:LysM repeat protein
VCVVGALLAPAAASAQVDTAAARQPRRDTASATHVVKRGDTLWDLAIAYLRDPLRWRELYAANRAVVENPHWIFPGERLRIPGTPADAVAARPAEPRAVVGAIAVTDADTTAGSFVAPPLDRTADPLALEARRLADYLAAPYLDRVGGPEGAGRVHATGEAFGSEEVGERWLSLGDPVRLTLPAGGAPTVGERFLTFTRGAVVHGGQIVKPTGIVEVTEFEGTTVHGRVIVVLDAMRDAQGLLALPAAPAAPATGADGATARVVWVENDTPLPALQNWLLLAPSSTAGLPEQAEVRLVRRGDGDAAAGDELLGTARIVRVTPHAASAIITNVSQPGIAVGSTARLGGEPR